MSQNILFLAHVSEAGSTLPNGSNVDAAAETIAAAGAERILAVAGPDFATARYASDAAAAEALCRASGADLILAPATSRFMRVLAGVAHRLNGCVDTHVTSLELLSGEVCATRWYYRQRIEGVIRRDARPWIVLLESGCSAAWTGAPSKGNIEEISVTLPQAATRLSPASALRRAMLKPSGPMLTCCLSRARVGRRNKQTGSHMSIKLKS